MDKIGDFFSKIGSLFRDIFSYLIPSVSFILLAIPLLKKLGWLNPELFNYESIISNTSVLGITFLVVIFYTVGRILYAFSLPIICIIESLTLFVLFILEVVASVLFKMINIGKKNKQGTDVKMRCTWLLGESWLKKMIDDKNRAKGENESKICDLALNHGLDEYYYLFERGNFIHNSENSFCAGFFIIGLLLACSLLSSKLLAVEETSKLFCVMAFGTSFLFYYLTLGSYKELSDEAEALKSNEEQKKGEATKPRKTALRNYYVVNKRIIK